MRWPRILNTPVLWLARNVQPTSLSLLLGMLHVLLAPKISLIRIYRANSLIIHYTTNDQIIRDDEMILIDAGCEYKLVPSLSVNRTACNLLIIFSGYASDISECDLPEAGDFLTFCSLARTYPASGTYSPAQRDLYTAVLNAQKELIKLCTIQSGYTLMDVHRKSVDLLTEELKQIGFGSISKAMVERELYPHYVGHPIGIGKFFCALF